MSSRQARAARAWGRTPSENWYAQRNGGTLEKHGRWRTTPRRARQSSVTPARWGSASMR